MLRPTKNMIVVGACFLALLAIGQLPRAHGAGISISFAADNAAARVGGLTAGVISLAGWNDVPSAPQTNLPLHDNTGAVVPGLTLTTVAASATSAGGVAFTKPGDSAMMKGHVYLGGAMPMDLTFTGAIPYASYSIYAYYNSGAVTNTQTYSILDSAGADLGITSQIGFELAGGDTSFIASDGVGGGDANYVLFSGLTGSSVPTNFIIRSTSDAYTYFNGLQIVQTGTVGSIDGDLNNDTTVNTADFTIFRSFFLTSVTAGTKGDFNGDGSVELEDFTRFRGFYEAINGVGSSASLAVPEPSTFALLLAGVPALLWLGKRRLGRGLTTTHEKRRTTLGRTCSSIGLIAGIVVLTTIGTSRVQAVGISINFGADISAGTPVGAQSAGVVSLGNWNDIPLAQQTNLAIKDSTGAASGLTLTTGETFTVPATAVGAGGVAFLNAGDTAMMTGHIYHGGNVPLDLTFTGTIPYSNFDVYVYYNSSAVPTTQEFSILDSSGGTLGLSRIGKETPGGDTAYILSDGVGGNEANFVRFSGLTSASVPTNFIIRSTATDNQYAYFNGIQIVQQGTVPLPTTVQLIVNRLIGAGGTPESSALAIVNPLTGDTNMTGYTIRSPLGSLNLAGFHGLHDQNVAGWDEVLVSANALGELNLTASKLLAAGGGGVALGGNAFTTAGAHDLAFKYSTPAGTTITGEVVYKDLLAGDANGDKVVNIFDINLISSNWNTAGLAGDINFDGIVNIFDINTVSSHWANTLPGAGGATAVPEPSSWALLSLGAFIALLNTRRNRNHTVA